MAAPPHYGMPIPFMFVGNEIERTFMFEEDLPSLPVPQLDHTLAKYLDSGIIFNKNIYIYTVI